MPKKSTQKSATTQAGEYIKEVIDNVRKGKYGVRSVEQAIAIGLSKARKAGIHIKANPHQKKHAKKAVKMNGAKRSRATLNALRQEGKSAVSSASLSRHAHSSALRKGAASRHASARKAVRTRRAHQPAHA
jgi:hypothetical protein